MSKVKFVWNVDDRDEFVSSKMREDKIRRNLARAEKRLRHVIESF